MTDKKTIEAVVTKASLVQGLRHLGVERGMVLEVHASLSSFGYMCGGAEAVVDALMETVGKEGTLLMPCTRMDNRDPSTWKNPSAAPETWTMIREQTVPYKMTDSMDEGEVAQVFARRQDTVCSGHPVHSFTAWGKYARLLCNRQSLHFPLGEESPVARLYELRGKVLLLGVGLEKCACLHLAEYRTECRPVIVEEACYKKDDERGWKNYLDLKIDSAVFKHLEPVLEKSGLIHEEKIGSCQARLFSAAGVIDTATRYLEHSTLYNLYR